MNDAVYVTGFDAEGRPTRADWNVFDDVDQLNAESYQSWIDKQQVAATTEPPVFAAAPPRSEAAMPVLLLAMVAAAWLWPSFKR